MVGKATGADDQGWRSEEKKWKKETNKKDKFLGFFPIKYYQMLICSKYFSCHFFTLRHELVPGRIDSHS